MKKIALLHTVRSVYQAFEQQLREAMPGRELEVSNTLDEFLATDANRRGCFSRENLNRLLYLLQAKDLEQADLILVTCSTLTPAVERIRPFIRTPLVAIDEAMAQKAVSLGEKILVLATAGSAVEPEKQKLAAEAAKIGRSIALSQMVCSDAFRAIQRMDKAAHDELLREAAAKIENVDVVVLAQASMAHMEGEIQRISGCTTLSSPELCFAQVRQLLWLEAAGPSTL